MPDVFVLQITDGHPWEYGTDEFHDLVQKSAGANLAINLLNRALPVDVSLYASLPVEIISQVITLDVTFANFDRSTQSTNLVEDDSDRFWIIDHGSCRFLFQSPHSYTGRLQSGHIYAGMEHAFDVRWLRGMSDSVVSATIAEIPQQWLTKVMFPGWPTIGFRSHCLPKPPTS